MGTAATKPNFDRPVRAPASVAPNASASLVLDSTRSAPQENPGPPATREVNVFDHEPSFAPILLFGTVKDTKDPEKLGRVQVSLQGFGPELKLPWVRLLQPIASSSSGTFFLPEVGDEVVVLRGDMTNVDAMVVLGAVYNGKAKPKNPDADGKNAIKQILTKAGNELTFRDKSGAEGIDIVVAGQKVKITMDKKGGSVVIETDKEITLKATNKVTVQSKEVTIKGDAKVTIEGAQKVTVKSSANVEIVGSAGVKVQGAKVDIAGSMVNIG